MSEVNSEFRSIGGLQVKKDPLEVGKTKGVYQVVDEPLVILHSLPFITAGNGARREEVAGKGVISNEMTCIVFEYLAQKGIPVAFQRRLGPDCLLALFLRMYKLEVVERLKAYGSVCKREGLAKGTPLEPARFELYLKTAKCIWEMNGHTWRLPVDDPMMEIIGNMVFLFDPGAALSTKPFLELHIEDVFENPTLAIKHIEQMRDINLRAVLAIIELFAKAGIGVPDFKLEYGIHPVTGELQIGDVADLESGRGIYLGAPSGAEPHPELVGQHVCKQYFRQGGTGEETVRRYSIALDLLRKAVAA
ncbi:MAG: phosphoribosylaminoimidazolesuccinocarboxamide synthase [Candidatus Pacebacteria bacterium]|nr:phosphoribosylaminoimidazolesuccinocarboxamide synthase [Candidatus Paceibacterota bacterium]